MELKSLYTQLFLCVLVSVLHVSAQGEPSCIGRCGEGYFRGDSCHCDYNCMSYMECCQDFKAVCTSDSSCKGRCHDSFERGRECDCDANCVNFGKCCPDYEMTCAKPIQRRSPPPPAPPADEKDKTPDTPRIKEDDKERKSEKPPEELPRNQKPKKIPRRIPKKKKDNDVVNSNEETEEPLQRITPSSKEPEKGSPKSPRKKKSRKLINPEDETEDPSQEPGTLLSRPGKDNKRPVKTKPKTPKGKKSKTRVQSEEEIQESEENMSSSSFSSSVSSSSLKGSKTSKKLSQKKKKSQKDNPDSETPETNQNPSSKKPSATEETPPTTNLPGLSKKKTKKKPPADTEDSVENPKSTLSPTTKAKSTQRRSPTNTSKRRKKVITSEEETDEPSQNPESTSPVKAKKAVKKPVSKIPNKRRKKVLNSEEDTEEPSESPGSAPAVPTKNKKPTKKPSSKVPTKKRKKVTDSEEGEEDPSNPSVPAKGKKPPKKPLSKDPTKRKNKLIDSEEERQETVEKEFQSSSQSSSSHRRSKSTSRRLSENKRQKEKAKKDKEKRKIPEDETLAPPTHGKDKSVPPTTKPSFEDEGSGDDGSGKDFWPTSSTATTSITHLTTEDFQGTRRTTGPGETVSSTPMSKTENNVTTSDKTTTSTQHFKENDTTPNVVSMEEHSLRTPTTMSIFPPSSTASEDKTDNPTSSMSKLTTLQEQSTTDSKSHDNAQTTNVEGLLEPTNTMLYSSPSSGPTKDPSSSTNSDNNLITSKQTTNVEHTTLKGSEQTDASFVQPMGTSIPPSFTTQTNAPETTSRPVESNEKKISTEMTNRNTSPTTGQKTDDLRTSSITAISLSSTITTVPLQTMTPLGKRTDMYSKETVTHSDVSGSTGSMKSIPTSLYSTDAMSLKTTVRPSAIQQERTTVIDEAKKLTTEQAKGNLDPSTAPKSTVKPEIVSEQRSTSTGMSNYVATPKPVLDVTPKDNTLIDQPTSAMSPSTKVSQNDRSVQTTTETSTLLGRNTKTTPNINDVATQKSVDSVTAGPINIQEMENKTIFPFPLDPEKMCAMLKDKENKPRIPDSHLRRITEKCIEMQQHFPFVSTPSSDTRQTVPEQRKVPPRHTATSVTPPNEKMPPGSRIIQFVQEIDKRINIYPITNLPPGPDRHANKSTTWILLHDKIRNPSDSQMNLCNGQPADGMTTLQNGSMVVFRGHYFWMINPGGAPEKPRKISEVWGIPSPIDTVFTRCNCDSKTFFFKGPLYWRFTNHVVDTGYPKEIMKGFGGLNGKITAVLAVAGYKKRQESVHFFKGGNVQKYTFRQEPSRKCTKGNRPNVQYPIYKQNIKAIKLRFVRDITAQRIQIHRTYTSVNQHALGVLHKEVSVRSYWRGIPDNIGSAISLPNPQKQDGFDYFVFSKEKYYNINMSSRMAIKPPPTSEQNTSKDWYKCPE
ncbi:proteoglycan 4 isoform X5 [Ascaphus truei]|uniref:proteoglycan 4 isoform X5 n=1 Tax=Ascaphus truei TaxID=8439 RepID=UPI003F598EB5